MYMGACLTIPSSIAFVSPKHDMNLTSSWVKTQFLAFDLGVFFALDGYKRRLVYVVHACGFAAAY